MNTLTRKPVFFLFLSLIQFSAATAKIHHALMPPMMIETDSSDPSTNGVLKTPRQTSFTFEQPIRAPSQRPADAGAPLSASVLTSSRRPIHAQPLMLSSASFLGSARPQHSPSGQLPIPLQPFMVPTSQGSLNHPSRSIQHVLGFERSPPGKRARY